MGNCSAIKEGILLMIRILRWSFVMIILTFGQLQADELLRPDHPDRYMVKKGDTLWHIAALFLKQAWRWPQIWELNPDIENPHLIYPGDSLSLKFVDGQPRLDLRRGDEARTLVLTVNRTGGNDFEKLLPRVRTEPLVSSIPAISLEDVSSWFAQGRIVEKGTLANAPYILAGVSERLIFGPGDKFYGRGNWPDLTTVFGVFREGQIYRDIESREILGYEAQAVGMARMLSREGDLATFELLSVEEDVRVTDRLLPTEERKLQPTFYPKPPEQPIHGVVIAISKGLSMVGKNGAVVLNRGESQGLSAGTVLAVHKKGQVVRDRVKAERVELPSERVGLIMIYRSFMKMAYGIVLETNSPVRVGDEISQP